MAAVAARHFGTLASAASEKVGTVATQVRSENKETFDQIDDQCDGVKSTCFVVWAQAVELATSAFFPYLLVTFLLNIPPFAYGLASVFSAECGSSWLVFNAFLVAVHMGVSVYAVHRIRQQVKKADTAAAKVEEGESETPYVNVDAAAATSIGKKKLSTATSDPNSWDRIKVVMCYDFVMAVYYILCVVWMIWQGIGTRRMIDGEVDNECGRWVVLSVVCGFLYIGLGVVSWVGSLCFLRYRSLQEGKGSQDVLVVDDTGGISLA